MGQEGGAKAEIETREMIFLGGQSFSKEEDCCSSHSQSLEWIGGGSKEGYELELVGR